MIGVRKLLHSFFELSFFLSILLSLTHILFSNTLFLLLVSVL